MNYWQIDTELLNPSNIDQKLIQEAKEFLSKIGDAIKIQDQLMQESQKERKEPDYEKIREVKTLIADLSSRFYELIPHFQYKNEIAPPIQNDNMLKQKYDMLQDLNNIEMASKMLLGAL